MKKRLLLGSNNRKKRNELAAILDGLACEIVTPADLGGFEEPEENGETFEENARIKAFYYSGVTGLPTLADDSGLVVDALRGEPGVYSARYAGEGASDVDNCLKLLQELKSIPDFERTARFMCTIVVVHEK
ncbi:MAG: non-canonical purine NTP pyrophosphatase, partial [Planctomycetota bacterium]